MGQFDEAADSAAAKTDKELSEELGRFLDLDASTLARMFPATGDQEAASKLISKVNAATNHNEKVQALKEFGFAMSEAGARGLGKLIDLASKAAKAAMVALLLLTPAQAAESMSFGEFMKMKAMEAKAIYAISWHEKDGEKGVARHSGGAYVPINTLVSADGKYEYMDWGVGIEEPEGSEKPGLIVPIMVNGVALARKAFNFKWARTHIRSTSLPNIWGGALFRPPVKLSKRGLKEYKLLENIGIAFSVRFSGPWFKKKEGGENG